MAKHYKRSNRFIGRGIKMLIIKNRLIIQDLLEELERNKLTYEVTINKVIKNGDISNLEITIEVKDND